VTEQVHDMQDIAGARLPKTGLEGLIEVTSIRYSEHIIASLEMAFLKRG
jgi:hypothetical protein